VPVLGAREELPYRPQRVLIGGTSGSGKSTLARRVATVLALPYTEIDALYHGPGWTVRATFLDDVAKLAEQPSWVTDYQYSDARPQLLGRCDLIIYLLLPRPVVMAQIVRRTFRRSLRRELLWNHNIEPPLRTIMSDRDHIIRWAWRTHGLGARRVGEVATTYPNLPLVVLRSRREVAAWVDGPLAATARTKRSPGPTG
jgi:adenylate kinase family enzyme